MIIDDTGGITNVIIDFGGFLGIGVSQASLSFDELTILSTEALTTCASTSMRPRSRSRNCRSIRRPTDAHAGGGHSGAVFRTGLIGSTGSDRRTKAAQRRCAAFVLFPAGSTTVQGLSRVRRSRSAARMPFYIGPTTGDHGPQGAAMQNVTLNGLTHHVAVTGDPAGPPVVFANALGTDLRVWDRLLPHLPGGLRVIRYDMRGHGLSDGAAGPWSIDDLADDLAGILDALGIDTAVICGLSVGGMVAQSLAARHPGRVRALILLDTAVRIGTVSLWDERIATGHGGAPPGARRRPCRPAEAAKTASTPTSSAFITEGAWGSVWARPGLTLRERSM
jgi:hypothetical protein